MVTEASSKNPKLKPLTPVLVNLRRSAGPTLSYVDILRQQLVSEQFQALLELCVKNPGARPALGQHERVEFNAKGNVTKLNLSALPVSDLTALVALEDLTSLDISVTPAFDLRPLAQCKNLTRLWFEQTQVRDLSPLEGKGITVLMANQSKILNVNVLKSLPTLQFLGLEGTAVSELGPIAALSLLKELNIRNTRCSDLAPIEFCRSLQSLMASQCRIRSIAPLASLNELIKLDLSWNQISDCNGLQGLPKVREINLAGNPLQPKSASEVVHLLKRMHGDKIRISV